MAIVLTGDGSNGGPGGILSAGSTGVADGVVDGTVTVTGGNYTGANAFAQLHAGPTTDGVVTLQGGALVQVNAANYSAIRVGNDTGSTGILNVDGAGTFLYTTNTPSGLRVGRYGDGTLNVTNNGTLGTFFLDAGRKNGAVGTVNIDNAQILMNSNYGGFIGANAGEAAFGRIGRESGSKGYLNITNGGLLELKNTDGVTDTPAFQIGRSDGSYGKAIIDGVGSELRVNQIGVAGDSYTAFTNLHVGRNGQGILEVRNDGQVNITGDQAQVQVSAAFASSDNLVDAASQLRILSGADMTIDAGLVFGGRLFIATGANGRADVLVDGAGSTLNVNGSNGSIIIGGYDGNGTLTVTNSAVLNLSGRSSRIDIGRGNDTGPQITESKMYVTQGGVLNMTSIGNDYGTFASLGLGSDGNGYMLIDGAGSEVNITSQNNGTVPDASAFFNVGRGGKGTLVISDGGDLNISGGINDDFPGMNIGRNDGSIGTVTIDGAGSSITITGINATSPGSSGTVDIGQKAGAAGIVNITNGGQFILNGPTSAATVGRNQAYGGAPEASGTLSVDGAGSLFNSGQYLLVGASFDSNTQTVGYTTGGIGDVVAINGGMVQAASIIVGDGGTLSGNGIFDGLDVFLDGTGGATLEATATASPAFSTATLTITGDLNVNNGTIVTEISGTGAGQFDTVNVGGSATFNAGTLNFTIDPLFNSLAGDTISFVTGATMAFNTPGAFTYNFGGLAAGIGTLVLESSTALSLTFLNAAAGTAVLDLQQLNFSPAPTGASVTYADGNGTGSVNANENFAFQNVVQILGTDGDDVLNASTSASGADFDGGAGDDFLIGSIGDDKFSGGAGTDMLSGGAGNDTAGYSTAGAAVTVDLATVGAQNTGGGGIDTLISIENLRGSAFVDTLTGDGNANIIEGGGGNDIINGAGGTDTTSYENSSGAVTVDLHTRTTSGADGNDTLISIENATGSNFNDTLRGSAFAGDTIMGLGGNDTIVGRAGIDTMIGGDGDDSYFVQQLGDVVVEAVNEGNDTVRVYFDNYTLTANVEEGRVVGSANILFGNEFDNLLAGGGGADELHGGDGNDTLTGNGGGDTLFGDAGDDRLIGSAGADTLNGGADNDRLEGNADIDTMNGGAGDDDLFGGGGRDFMTGGLGADRFVFDDADYGGNTFALADRILDFSQLENDSIDLRPTDADTTTANDQAFTFIAGAAFSGTAGELRFIQSGGRTYVQGDTDGDGNSDFMIRLEGLTTLDAGDFLL